MVEVGGWPRPIRLHSLCSRPELSCLLREGWKGLPVYTHQDWQAPLVMVPLSTLYPLPHIRSLPLPPPPPSPDASSHHAQLRVF